MRESDWKLLLARIADGLCTPSSAPARPRTRCRSARRSPSAGPPTHGYPLSDGHDLARVAQYLAVHPDDAMYPKELLGDELRALPAPDFTPPGSRTRSSPGSRCRSSSRRTTTTRCTTRSRPPARTRAARSAAGTGAPPWRREPSPFADPAYAPTPANPLVYHLHGRLALPESLVLTEDDYLDFLVAIARDTALLPHQIQRALAGTSLLFVGYRLADWDFRVIHRGLVAATEAEPAAPQRDRPARRGGRRPRVPRPVLRRAEAARLLGHGGRVRRASSSDAGGRARDRRQPDSPPVRRPAAVLGRRTARCSSDATARSRSCSRS